MRERHASFVVLIAILLFALVAPLSAATATHWTVVNQPARLVNGTPVLFEVTTPTPVSALSGSWLGHEIAFSFEATGQPSSGKSSNLQSSNHESPTHESSLYKSPLYKSSLYKSWFALAGVSLETKPGTYPLELHAEISPGEAAGTSATKTISFERKIRIERQRYPRVQLKVPARYTAPSPEDQREIDKDKEIKAEAFKTLSDTREWEGSFSAPVDAEISDLFGVERVFNGLVQSTHQGLDFRVPSGTTVEAVNSGRIILAQPLFFEGN